MADNHRQIRGNVVLVTGNPFDESTTTAALSSTEEDRIVLGPGLEILLDHVLAYDTISTGLILSVTPARRTIIHSDCLVLDQHDFLCPGFIDLHIHAPQYSYAGTATDRPLLGDDGWLAVYTFPAERRLQNLQHARNVYDKVVRRTLRHGTTTAVYFATLHLEPCQVLVDMALHHGQRALVGKVCMDRNAPDDYCQSLEQNVEETRALVDYIRSNAGQMQANQPVPLVLPLITPRFIPTCTPALLSALGKLAAEYDCHVMSHLSESLDEVAYSRQLDATVDLGDGVGRTDAAIFQSHGLLTSSSIMAHCVHVTDKDAALMREHGAAIAFCPLSNFYFAGGSLPTRQLLTRGNKIGLGTDIAGGYSPSMLEAARLAVIASRAHQHQQHAADSNHVMDYRHALYLATLGGARALGLEDRIGRLAPGWELDAIVLGVGDNIDVFASDTVADVFQKLCVLGDDRNVKRVFVQGRDVTVT